MNSNKETLEKLRWQKIPVLNDGFICVVDAMGADEDVVQAARVSYNRDTRDDVRRLLEILVKERLKGISREDSLGTDSFKIEDFTPGEISKAEEKLKSDEERLLRRLMRDRHTTPFEMAEIKFLVRVPMDTWRQWIRHRTACLSGDTKLDFDLPGGIERRGREGKDGTQLYQLTVKDVFDRFQPTTVNGATVKRERVENMQLRCLNEATGKPTHTQIVDIWETGVKPIYTIITESGAHVNCSIDHLFLTDSGWLTVKDFDIQKTKLSVITSGKNIGVKTKENIVDTSTEAWAPIVDWEEYYEVSTQGRIRRITGGRGTRSFGRCKQTTISNGRMVVSLNRPGVQEVRLVHRLMALAFLGEPGLGEECCHDDGNCLNNTIENLYWGVPKENASDRVRDGATTRLCRRFEQIIRIKQVGEEMTYDLEVTGPWHNFSANGLVVHNSVNEYSTRYTEAIDARQETPPDMWRLQATNNKQGSSGLLTEWPSDHNFTNEQACAEGNGYSPGSYLSIKETEFHGMAQELYQERLQFGIAREQARKDLPLSTYTEAYWKCDLGNILHFLGLRMDSHAQLEIRQYANAMGSLVEQLFPVTWQAFKDYRLESMTLSQLDKLVIVSLSALGFNTWTTENFDRWCKQYIPDKTERNECVAKLKELGLVNFKD